MKDERWAFIPGQDRYLISTEGRVIGLPIWGRRKEPEILKGSNRQLVLHTGGGLLEAVSIKRLMARTFEGPEAEERVSIPHGVGDYCVRGHEFTEANTYQIPSRPGVRYCRKCRRIHDIERNARRRQARKAAKKG